MGRDKEIVCVYTKDTYKYILKLPKIHKKLSSY